MSNRALIIGIGTYPPGISTLPAVPFDVDAIADLLGSSNGSFRRDQIRVLPGGSAQRQSVIDELRDIFRGVQPEDTIFVYIAGHGCLDANGEYYFVPYDTKLVDLSNTAVPLREIKSMFDQSRSERILLWLDFCHSGGILARKLEAPENASAVVERTLRITQGLGKVIMCACTADQSAYESANHGHFTKYLVEGLRGAASNSNGEVTANSLHDYIDQQMGSARQRPMFFGEMTGRIVLMHSRSASSPPKAAPAEADASHLVVTDSGSWVLIDDLLVEATSVKQRADGEIAVTIPSESAEDDARIRALKPERAWGSRAVAFAHRNDGFIVRVSSIESESMAQGASWTLTLKAEATEYGGGISHDVGLQADGKSYSADKIAEMRAGRLLLNDPPSEGSTRQHGGRINLLESFIQGMGTQFPVTDCIFKKFSSGFRSDPERTMQMARLAAIYALKASQVFEQITELRLGPLHNGKLHVRCRGKRRDQFVGQSPTALKIEGDCPLD
jgi:uncharacterized caspase-like protein